MSHRSEIRKSLFVKTSVAVGGLLGALALGALAQTTWTAPSNTPPNGNVAVPLNVGATNQTKTGGSIQINGGFGIAGGPFIYLTATPPSVGQVLTALDANGTVGWGNLPAAAAYNDCLGEGLIWVIGDGSMNDGGSSGSGDQLQVYCHAGTARYCLSHETNCPWRDVGISSDSVHSCSMHGLNSGSYAPGHPTWIYVANAWGDMWNGNSNYYCEADTSSGSSYATQLGYKHVYYLTSVNGVCTTASASPQTLASNSFLWSVVPSGGDGSNYTYTWSTTGFSVATSTGSTASETVHYNSTGSKTMTVNISSGGQTRAITCTPTVNVQ